MSEDETTVPSAGEVEAGGDDQDGRLVSTDGPLPWPSAGTHERKEAVLQHVLEAEPSASQAEILRNALARESDAWVVKDLMRALLRHEKQEHSDESGRWYVTEALDRVYEHALAAAQESAVRVALHSGFAQFRLRGSPERISEGSASRLVSKLRNARDVEEQRGLMQILLGSAGYDEKRLLSIMDAWLEDGRRSLSGEDLTLWSRAVEQACKASSWRSDRLKSEASARLRRALPRLVGDALVRALELLANDLYEKDCEDVLIEHAEGADEEARLQAIRGLARGGERGRAALVRILEGDKDGGILSWVWNSLEKLGEKPGSLARLVANKPEPILVANLLGGHVRDAELRSVWPILAAPVREALEKRHRDLRHHHGLHDLDWHHLWHELREREPQQPALTAALISMIARPLHERLGVYDLESVTGLRRRDDVAMRTVQTLRFGFLAERKTARGVSVRERFAEVQRGYLSLDKLLEHEQEFDTLRDRAAGMRRDMETLARSLGDEIASALRRAAPDARERGARQPLDEFGKAGRQYAELLDEYEHLERRMAPENDGGPVWYLYTATREWLPVLREEGVSFAGMLAPDGVLGEYQTEDRGITLFAPMIELAAREVARELGMPPLQVEPLVRTVVEIHELSHAHAHLGRDAGDAIWSTPDKDTGKYHEALAQAYTRKLVAALGRETRDLEKVLHALERWLPAEYHHAAHLLTADPEALRSYVVTRRSRARARTQRGSSLRLWKFGGGLCLPYAAFFFGASFPSRLASCARSAATSLGIPSWPFNRRKPLVAS